MKNLIDFALQEKYAKVKKFHSRIGYVPLAEFEAEILNKQSLN